MIHFILLALLGTATARTQEKDKYPLRPAVECTPRSGLPNFRAKVEAGKTVKIAYLGGSITAAAGWRVKSREWLEETYPEAQFEEIHAAIGGTGSDLGVFRLQNDALNHKPDLLFVEFAVNDGGAAPERIHKAMEGIVRQTWKANPSTDICFVYTLMEKMLPTLQSGKMPRAASAMEAVADHYGIPSIHFGVKVAAMEKAGELIFKAPKTQDPEEQDAPVFSHDGVHPIVETGHQIYADTIARSWPDIWSAGNMAEPRELKAPFREDNWEEAKQLPITESMLSGEWEKLPEGHSLARRFRRNMPELFQAKKPGASLRFTLKGSSAAVFDLLGPDGGQLKIQINEEEPKLVKKIDGYCTYSRMSKTSLLADRENGEYRTSITLTPENLNKRDILFEKNRGFFDENPEKYTEHTWYAGSLLVIGEVVE